MAGSPALRAQARHLAWLLLAGAIAAAVLAGLWRAAAPETRTLDQRARDVAVGLRCPSCQGQSVAASESDLARQMRQVIREQLARGRSPGQVRSWFAVRYGDGVLLDPPLHGAGVALAVVPVAVLACGLLVLARAPGRRRLALAAAGVAAVGLATVVAPAARDRPDGSTAVAPGSAAVAPATSASPPASLLSLAPEQLTRRALQALRDGDPALAERLAGAALGGDDRPSAAATDAMLVLGLAQRARHEPAAGDTLRAFLAAAPSHPAAARVRALLAADG